MSSSRLSGEEKIALAGLVTTFVVTAAWWALALWPVADSPEWLVRTRYVCFGVSESGLPDAGGWIGLVAGPLAALITVLVGWGSAVRTLAQRARSSVVIAGVLGGMVFGTFALLGGAALRVQTAQADNALADEGTTLPPSNYPRLNHPSPALELIAQNGNTLRLTDLRGRVVLLTFAYAHCTTICPVIVRDVLVAQQQLEAQQLDPVVLVVTLDPWRDTPSRLASMAADWRFPAEDAFILSGEVPAVERVLNAWNVPYKRDETNGAVTHPSLVYLIDAQGRIAFASTGGTATMVELARRALQPAGAD